MEPPTIRPILGNGEDPAMHVGDIARHARQRVAGAMRARNGQSSAR
jgi:hypothetical protein